MESPSSPCGWAWTSNTSLTAACRLLTLIASSTITLGAATISAQGPFHPPAPQSGRHYPDRPNAGSPAYETWYSTTRSDTVIIFVHGILSNNRDAWWFHDDHAGTDSTRDAYWAELVATDARFNSPSIFLAGYYTSLNSGQYDIVQAAGALARAIDLTDINANRVLSKRNIVFVTHSTGGIVIRYLLFRYQYLFRGKNVGLVLIASPSLGSQWADRAALAISLVGNDMAAELRPDNQFLNVLFGEFQSLVDNAVVREFEMAGASACEHHFVIGRGWFHGDKNVVVTPESCGAFFGEPAIMAGTDHYSVVKPNGVASPSHLFLVNFFQGKFGPLVTRRTSAPDSIRIAIVPKPYINTVVDSAWTGVATIPAGVCATDSALVVKFAAPQPWTVSATGLLSAQLSDSANVRIESVSQEGDSLVLIAVRRRLGGEPTPGRCTATGSTLSIRAPMSLSRLREAASVDSTVAVLTRTSPQAVIAAPSVDKLSSKGSVVWRYEMRASGTINGTAFDAPLQETLHVASWAINAFVLADGRLLLFASPAPALH